MNVMVCGGRQSKDKEIASTPFFSRSSQCSEGKSVGELLDNGLGTARGANWVTWSGRAFLITKERPDLSGDSSSPVLSSVACSGSDWPVS